MWGGVREIDQKITNWIDYDGSRRSPIPPYGLLLPHGVVANIQGTGIQTRHSAFPGGTGL